MKQLKWMAMIAVFAFSMLASNQVAAHSISITQESNIELAQQEQVIPRKKRRKRRRAIKRQRRKANAFRSTRKRRGCRASRF